MIKQYLLLMMALMTGTVLVHAQRNTGTIKGTVYTSDHKPAESVTIHLKGNKHAVEVTDSSGSFIFHDVPAGTQTIEASLVGYKPVMQTIVVEKGKTATTLLQLELSRRELEAVTVTSHTNRFARKESDNIARLPLKDLENPQVYNVVTGSLIKERTVTNYSEIFYNTPAVTPPSVTYSRGNEYYMRGFINSTEFKDGLVYDVGEAEDPVNLERVEVLKGPAGTLFGSNFVSFGGTINNVTKTPFDTTGGEVSYAVGSWGLSRLTLDYNTPLNKDTTVLFRINAARHWENSFQDYGFKHAYTIAPTILYRPSERLTLRLSAEWYSQNSTMWQWYSFGPDVTIKNIRDLKAPYNRSAAGDQMLQSWSNTRLMAKAEYKLSAHWTSSTNFMQEFYYRPESYYMNGNEYINDSTMTRWIMGARPQMGVTTEFQQNFTGDFKIGGLRNRLLLGIDVLSQRYTSSFVGAYQDTIVMNDPSSLVNVSKEKILSSFYMVPGEMHFVSLFYDYSAYASDVLNITDRLLAMASLRVDRFDNKNSVNSGVEQTDGYQQTALSPKFGLVYQLVKNKVSLFGNYMNGFSNNAPQTDGISTVTYKPSQANQWEGGVKLDVCRNKLSATISYYNIDVKDALRSVPPSLISVQDGTQKSKGVEIEVIANPLAGLNLMAGYGYNNARYLITDAATEGLTLGSPKNIANFYASYKLTSGKLKGWGINAGINYVGEANSTVQYTVIIPSYVLFNAALMYDGPRLGAGFKVNNLLNQQYWSWNFIQAQPPRNIVATLTYKF